MKHADTVKTNLERLRAIVSGKKHPFILIYGNPDPDALASAWTLKELIHKAGVTATIGYTGEIWRLENASMIDSLRIPAVQLREDDLRDADLIALVDSQPGFFRSFAIPRCDIVIDHHPRKERRRCALSDIRPSRAATSSILAEYLQASGVRCSKRLATALYYGILTDARSMQRWPSAADIATMRFLQKRADRNLLRRIEFSSYSLERLDYFSIALVKLRYSRNILYSHLGPVPSADVCAQIADFLIRVKEANWALVSGVAGKSLVVVFRCDGQKKHAGKTAQAAFGKIGSAGGHRTMGRAEIDADALPNGILLTQNDRIEHFILESLSRVERGFRPLLRSLPT